MAEQSRSMSRTPLGDVTNTSTIGVTNGEAPNTEDRIERKRLKEKERYAAISQEKKDELNRKRRERRKQKNVHASVDDGMVMIDNGADSSSIEKDSCIVKGIAGVDHKPMEGDECNDWLSRGKLEKCNDNKQLLADSPGDPIGHVPDREDPKDRKRRKDKERYAAMPQEKKDKLNRNRREKRKQKNVQASDGCVPMDKEERNECLRMGILEQYNVTEHDEAYTPGMDMSEGLVLKYPTIRLIPDVTGSDLCFLKLRGSKVLDHQFCMLPSSILGL